MIKNKLFFLFFLFCVKVHTYAQSSIVNDSMELKRLLSITLNSGYSVDKCLDDDTICNYLNEFQKQQFQKLQTGNIGAFKIFSVRLSKTLTSSSFVDSFRQYFMYDASKYSLMYYSKDSSGNNILGSIMSNFKESKFSGITSQLKVEHYFINLSQNDSILLFYPMRFDDYYIVKNNSIFFIVDLNLVHAGEYFAKKGYTLEEITWRFFGVR